jgi:type VI protein secretion system component Hcp
MEKVVITAHQISGSNENPTESISFAFSKVKVSYNPEKDGKLQGFVDKGWDVEKLATW